jgi:hypothetical protein
MGISRFVVLIIWRRNYKPFNVVEALDKVKGILFGGLSRILKSLTQ